MKTRLQALGVLDRSFRVATDDELDAMLAALDDDHRDAAHELIDGDDAGAIRTTVASGRLDGTMESVAVVLTDTCLADCIKELGDDADHPSTDQLRDVLPGLIERHGLASTRIMLASAVVGEANAASIIRDLLKHDDTVKLPPAEAPTVVPERQRPTEDDTPERTAIKERRKELKQKKQAEARARREQAARARHRS